MKDKTPLKFGTVEVASAYIGADERCLRLHLLEGRLEKDELEMLIQFLQAKRDQLEALQ